MPLTCMKTGVKSQMVVHVSDPSTQRWKQVILSCVVTLGQPGLHKTVFVCMFVFCLLFFLGGSQTTCYGPLGPFWLQMSPDPLSDTALSHPQEPGSFGEMRKQLRTREDPPCISMTCSRANTSSLAEGNLKWNRSWTVGVGTLSVGTTV